MKKFLKFIFSVRKERIQTTVCCFGIKIRLWNYRRMLREVYKYQKYLFWLDIFDRQNIALPPEARYLWRDFEVARVALKDIRREWQGKLYSLDDVSPFKYLQTRDEAIYAAYVQKHKDCGLAPPDSEWSVKGFENLIASMDENGYDVSKSIIVLDRNNVLVDGQHRACILYYKYGGDYLIKVVREMNKP